MVTVMHWFCFVLGVIHVYESPLFYYDHNGEGCFRQSTQCILDMYIPMERKIKTALKQLSLTFLSF